MRHGPLLAALAILVVAALPAPGGRATAQAAGLDEIEGLVASGSYDAARSALEQWWAGRESGRADGNERARALMLRARLAPDLASAEADYLSIVLGYPLAPHAPQALLRLGQGLLAVDEAERSVGYLRRLVADYPGRPERSWGILWLARAEVAARQTSAACNTARLGLREPDTSGLADMLRALESLACSTASEANTNANPPASATPRPARPSTSTPAAANARFAVQVGAFRQQDSVDDAVTRLRRAGHEPRAVGLPGSSLVRVRVGRFATRQEAEGLLAQLRSRGFDALVVDDVQRERSP
jgi:hypothetical protein